MKVLVTAASKHGATAEVAGEIGEILREALRERGEDVVVDVSSPEEVGSVEDYETPWCSVAQYTRVTGWRVLASLSNSTRTRFPPARPGCSPWDR